MAGAGLFLVGSPDGGTTKKVVMTDNDGRVAVTDGGATQTTLAAILAKLSDDPATEATLEAILGAIQAQEPYTDVLHTTHHDATTENSDGVVADVTEYANIGFMVEGTFGDASVEFQASIDGETFFPLYCTDAAMGGNSGVTTNTAGLYSADVRGYTHVRAAITGVTTGTELTVKSVAISAQRSGSPLVNISDREDRVLGKVQLNGSIVTEQKTEADAVANVLTFSAPIQAVEIYHEAATRQTFVVNGITLYVPPGSYRTPVGGTPSVEVTIPAGVTCIVGRLV